MSHEAGIGAAWSRGPVNGDATVEPIMGAYRRSLTRLRGQIPKGAPLPPSDAPRLRDAHLTKAAELPILGALQTTLNKHEAAAWATGL